MNAISTAPQKSVKKPKGKVSEFIMTAFAVVFTLMPLIVMVTWVGQFIEISGAGGLASDFTDYLSGVFYGKER